MTSALRRKTARHVTVAAAAATLLGATAAPAAADSPTVVRYAGADRFETAVTASRQNFPAGSVADVVVASGYSSIDALSASALSGSVGSPVLLADGDHLPAQTLAEVHRLGALQATVVGDEKAVGPSVVAALQDAGLQVRRVAGDDRYQTAAALTSVLPTRPSTVFLAAGTADAAAVAPVAAATGWPVLLTTRDDLPAATSRALADLPGARVVVLGGTDRISDAVAVRARAAQRIAGDDRTATATGVAEFAVSDAGFSDSGFGLAAGFHGPAGDDLVDALVAGPVLARSRTPLLLSASAGSLGPAATRYAAGHAGADRLPVFGGPTSVSDDVVATARASATTTATPATPRPPENTPPVVPTPVVPTPVVPTPVVPTPVVPTPTATPTAPQSPQDGQPRVLAVSYDMPGLPPVFEGFHRGEMLLVVPSAGWRLVDDDVRLTLDVDGPDAEGRYGTGEVVTYTCSTPTSPRRGTAELLWVDQPYSDYMGEIFLQGPRVPQTGPGRPGAAVRMEANVTDFDESGVVARLAPDWVPITKEYPA